VEGFSLKSNEEKERVDDLSVDIEDCRSAAASSMTLPNWRVIRISAASILVGILIGLVGGAFRFLLIAADHWRDALIACAHRWPKVGWLVPIALGLSAPL
jgi:uncharacterized protein involved in cysteine biosynthesis